MGLLANAKARFARARARAGSLFSYGTSGPQSWTARAPSTPDRAAMPADGNVGRIQDFTSDADVIAEVRARHTATTYPDGTTVFTAERTLVQRVAAEQPVATAATEFMGEQPRGTSFDALTKALEEGNSNASMQTKAMIVKSFIIVALATGGIAYFLISGKERKECIDKVFAAYPMFTGQSDLERKIKELRSTCATAPDDEVCRQINGAYKAIRQCDNTLFRNIVGEALSIGGDAVDWVFDQAGKGFDFFNEIVAKVWPLVLIGVGALLVIGLVVFLATRTRRVAPAAPAFGRGCAPRCTGRRGIPRGRCA
jgi:hypothetical protein